MRPRATHLITPDDNRAKCREEVGDTVCVVRRGRGAHVTQGAQEACWGSQDAAEMGRMTWMCR